WGMENGPLVVSANVPDSGPEDRTNGFEPSTSWSRTGVSENLRPCGCGCRTYKQRQPKNPASIGPQLLRLDREQRTEGRCQNYCFVGNKGVLGRSSAF